MSSNSQASDGTSDTSTIEAEPERVSTELHRACSDPSVTIDELRVTLNADRSAASRKDPRGRLPLHVVAGNRELHAVAGEDLDCFILDELLPRYRQASTTPDDSGAIPFVAAIKEWIELTHGFQQTPPLEPESEDASSASLASPSSDPEVPDEAPNGEKLDKVIPPRLVVAPVVSWSIHMLSTIIDRERRSTSFIVTSVASIPSLLKALLLVEDDEEREELFRTTVVCEALLCSESLGPWLVWMLKSNKRVAQERAVIYLETISSLSESFLLDTLTSPSSLSVLFHAQSSNEKKKHEIYMKATKLLGLIQAMLHLERSSFERAASTGIVQFILDQQMFQPKTLFVIVLDISFLSLVIVFFMLSSEAFFAMAESPIVRTLYPNETIWELCRNGTILDLYDEPFGEEPHSYWDDPSYSYDDPLYSYCSYFRAVAPRDAHYDDRKEALHHEICTYPFYYKKGLVQANSSLSSHGDLIYRCKENMTFYPNETIQRLCSLGSGSHAAASWEAHNLSYCCDREKYCRYYFAWKHGSYYLWVHPSYFLRGLDLACYDATGFNSYVRSYFTKGLTDQKPNNLTDQKPNNLTMKNASSDVVCMQVGNRRTTLVVGMAMITLGASYFFLRHLCAWHNIPRRLMIRKFGFWSVVDILSISMAVSMQGVFVFKEGGKSIYGLISRNSVEIIFQNEEIMRSLAAATSGLLFAKGLGYFKMLNRYLATFVFALGVIAEDIFWFVCIILLTIVAFSQMFYTILSGGNCTSGSGDQSPFCEVKTTYLYVYTILLGDFDVEDFSTVFSKVLFAVYSFAGIIVLLNFLIAIISDSYDRSMTKISNHFGRARVLFIVEVNAFLDFFRIRDTIAAGGGSTYLLGWWRDFRQCMWGRSLEHCSWSVLGVGGVATGATILFLKNTSWPVNLVGLVVVPIVSCFLSIWTAGGCFDQNTCFVAVGNFLLQNWVSRFVGKWLGKFLLFGFRFILGRSGEGTTTADDVGDKEWSGRLQHIKEEMSRTVIESEARLSQAVKQSEARMDKQDEELRQIKRLLESLIEKRDDAGSKA